MKQLLPLTLSILMTSCGVILEPITNNTGLNHTRNRQAQRFYSCSEQSFYNNCSRVIASRRLLAHELFGYQCYRDYDLCLNGYKTYYQPISARKYNDLLYTENMNLNDYVDGY